MIGGLRGDDHAGGERLHDPSQFREFDSQLFAGGAFFHAGTPSGYRPRSLVVAMPHGKEDHRNRQVRQARQTAPYPPPLPVTRLPLRKLNGVYLCALLCVAALLTAGCSRPVTRLEPDKGMVEFCRGVPYEDSAAREDCAAEWSRRQQ